MDLNSLAPYIMTLLGGGLVATLAKAWLDRRKTDQELQKTDLEMDKTNDARLTKWRDDCLRLSEELVSKNIALSECQSERTRLKIHLKDCECNGEDFNVVQEMV